MRQFRSPIGSMPFRDIPSSAPMTASQALLAAAVMAAVVATLPAQVPVTEQFAVSRKSHVPLDMAATAMVLCGDVDGDGDVDIVSGDAEPLLYLNDGGGVFTVAPDSQSWEGRGGGAMAMGDVDGDGDLDLVVGRGGYYYGYRDPSTLYLNDGTGRFTDGSSIGLSLPLSRDETGAVAFGDVDGDGDLDLLMGNRGQDRLYLNDGRGKFSDATAGRMPVDIDTTGAVALGDVDGDGDPDIVTGGWGEQARLLLNDGTGTFIDVTAGRMPVARDVTRAMVLGDVDGDGDLDLVIANGWCWKYCQSERLYLNDGAGRFTDVTDLRMPIRFGFNDAVAIGDVDGDGDLDLVFASSFGRDRLCLNDGTGTFRDATDNRLPARRVPTWSVVLADVDRDGDSDIVTGSLFDSHPIDLNQNRLLLNDGRGTFSDATAPAVRASTYASVSTALGDVDGDGDVDLLCGGPADLGSGLCLNDGTGRFTEVSVARFTPGPRPRVAVLCDVDLDGDLDAVIGHDGDQNRLYLNDGRATFTEAPSARPGARLPRDADRTQSIVCGDLDGDGDPDLVMGNDGRMRLYINNGAGFFTDVTGTRLPMLYIGSPKLVLGDLDSDGDLDILVAQFGQNRLLVNDGTGVFTDVTAAGLPAESDETQSVALGDVDSDGDIDAVTVNSYSSGPRRGVRLYLNDGVGRFTDASASRMPGQLWASRAMLGDVDEDGDLDIVLSNHWGEILRNDGSGRFASAGRLSSEAGRDSPRPVALGDLDGDGDVDLIATFGWEMQVLVNLQRHLHAPWLLRAGHPYRLEVYARSGSPTSIDFALPFLSTIRAPVAIPPYGLLGIVPMAQLPPMSIPKSAGVATTSLAMPNVPALAGVEVLAQALVVHWPFEARFTNVTADVVLR